MPAQEAIATIDLARTFFEEWDHLLTRAEKLQALDDSRVTVNRERVHTDEIATLHAIAASFERIGTALKKAHHGER